MKPVHVSLEQWIKEKKISQRLKTNQTAILNHPLFEGWQQVHPEWKTDDVTPYLTKISQYVKEQSACKQCKGLQQCSNMMNGHAPQLISYGTMLDLTYLPCSYYEKQEKEKARKDLIKSHHVPKEIIQSSFRDFDRSDTGRRDAFEAVLQFCLTAEPGKSAIGLFLYGGLGVGKSYLLGAACNKLAERDIATYMVYSPDFFREMKNAIADHSLEQKLQTLKEVPVLILDDIGAETISAWARDEVLGPILNYRITEQLPTLFTSNYSYDQLEEHLAYSQKGGIEQLKAKRIMERIRHYTDAYLMSGPNRRVR